MKCPVCDINTFNDYDYEHNICRNVLNMICQVDDPDFYGGANDLSLNEYKKVYNELKRQNSKFSCKNEKDLKLMLELTNIY